MNKPKLSCSLLGLSTLLVMGCGIDQSTKPYNYPDPTQVEDTWVNSAPTLLVASPNALAVSDDMTILGEHFVDKAHGQALVRFTGQFIDEQGQSYPVEFQDEAEVLNETKARWSMWPNVRFSPAGDQLGRFVGAVEITNHGNDGTTFVSAPLPVTVEIKPSLLPRVISPLNEGCGNIVARTHQDIPMSLTVEAIGLRRPTTDAPLRFQWTFVGGQWDVATTHGVVDPKSIVPDTGGFTLEQQVTEGMSSSVSDSGTESFLLKVGEDLIGTTRIKRLRTGTLPDGANAQPINVAVAATDGSGRTAVANIKLTITRVADLIYHGGTTLAERFPPVQVSDCIPGEDIGRDVTYYEAKSESRQRSMGFNYNANVGVGVAPFPSNPFMLTLNFSVGFGVNVNQSLSTDNSRSLNLSGHILPGNYGVFYRQTSKVLRVGKLVGYTVCGQELPLGEAILTDWVFSPEMAQGGICVPPSGLPPAQKFVD